MLRTDLSYRLRFGNSRSALADFVMAGRHTSTSARTDSARHRGEVKRIGSIDLVECDDRAVAHRPDVDLEPAQKNCCCWRCRAPIATDAVQVVGAERCLDKLGLLS